MTHLRRYTNLINACARCGEVEQAKALFKQMKKDQAGSLADVRVLALSHASHTEIKVNHMQTVGDLLQKFRQNQSQSYANCG